MPGAQAVGAPSLAVRKDAELEESWEGRTDPAPDPHLAPSAVAGAPVWGQRDPTVTTGLPVLGGGGGEESQHWYYFPPEDFWAEYVIYRERETR